MSKTIMDFIMQWITGFKIENYKQSKNCIRIKIKIDRTNYKKHYIIVYLKYYLFTYYLSIFHN